MELDTYTYTSRGGWSGALGRLDSDRSLVIAFAGASHIDRRDALDELLARHPRATVIGCSTAGEIADTVVADDTVVAAVARLEKSHIQSVVVAAPPSVNSFEAGKEVGRALAANTLRAVMVLSDGLNVNGSELVRGLDAALPSGVIVTGGLAADGDRFARTWVLGREGPRTGHIVAVGLHGEDLLVGHGSKGGWDMFGLERIVTRSRANVLYELDGRPALQLYKDYLGDRADGLPATALLFPLALRSSRQAEERVVRTILSVDEAAQSMTFAGDVPEGSLAQLMRANFDRLVDGAGAAAVSAVDGCPGAALAVAISCVGRRLVLGVRAEEEIEATLDVLPAGARQIGFYSYGEISPHATGRCELHNQTMTITTIAER